MISANTNFILRNISIQAKSLSKYFGNRVIFRNISFTYARDVLGISGSNGSGKSTLMKCLGGLWRPSKGKVRWRVNEQQVDFKRFKQSLGYVAPYINLYNELTCFENLNFLLQFKKVAGRANSINETLKKVDMLEFSDQAFQNLSTGQQQRMRIAAGLVHQPEVLFLDEPGSNLDRAGRDLIKLIVSEFKEAEKLIIVASNNEEELRLCDKIYSVENEAFNEK